MKFDGTTWSSMGTVTAYKWMSDVINYNNTVYVSGFTQGTGAALHKYQGGSWVPGEQDVIPFAIPYSAGKMVEYNGELNVELTFSSNGDWKLCNLQNDTLYQSTFNLKYFSSDHAVYQGELYLAVPGSVQVGGQFVHGLYKYDGTNYGKILGAPDAGIVDSINGKLFIQTPYDSVQGNVFSTIPDFAVIKGRVYHDANQDCFKNTGETEMSDVQVTLSGYTVSTNHEGEYTVVVSPGTYAYDTIRFMNLLQKNYATSCMLPQQITLGANQKVTQHIGSDNLVKDDLTAVISAGYRARYGFTEDYSLEVLNNGNNTVSNAIVRVTFPTSLNIKTTTPTPSSQTGNVLSYTVSNLQPNSRLTFKVSAEVDTAQNSMFDSLYFYNEVIYAAETDPTDNIDTLMQQVRGAYDPNDKQASATLIGVNTKSIDYHIRFQNTGNDTANKVTVVDTLDLQLPLTNVIINSASDPYSLSIQNNVLIWEFNNIMLPDSNVDAAGSQGYVNFTTGIAPGLNIGDTIKNKAEIYFDFQHPIKTNKAKSAVVANISIEEQQKHLISLQAYPNPAKDVLYLKNSVKELQEIKLIDFNGRVIRILGIPFGEEYALDISQLQDGIYLIKSENEVIKMVVSH